MTGGGSHEDLPQLGNYSVLEHLATGGMAEVFLARKQGLQGFEKFVVIKRIRPELTNDAHTMGLFLDEARLVATLEHPNIAQVYEIDRDANSYFIVMEYVQGADLRQIIDAARKQKQRIRLDDAIYIITHVCAALHYAHEKCDHDGRPLDIIHRDISPSNVLVSHDGAVKVCDFGIATGRNRTTETVQGAIKGKLSYLSPEQCRSERLDCRSDVFAIGILLYELSTLTKLFKANSEFELLRTIIEDPIPPPSQRVADYPEALSDIVMRALAKNPEDRYPTAQALQADLEAFAREHKLAMSSINIARLMGKLFERPSGSRRARGFEQGDADTDVDTRERPPFDAYAEGSVPPKPTVREPRPAVGSVRRSPSKVTPVPKRPSALWLVGALAAGAAAIAMPYVAPARGPSVSELEQTLRVDAERLGATIDTTARASQLEVTRLAATPMLRAAIATDAATLHDLAANEHVLAAAPSEVIEVFQQRDGMMVSMVRVPASAAPLPVPDPGTSLRLASDSKDLRLIATAPIDGTGGSGAISSSVPVDLALVTQSLAKSAHTARLAGVSPELTLVDKPDAAVTVTALRAPAPSKTLPTSPLAIVATLDAVTGGPSWILPAQIAAGVVATSLVLAFLFLLARRRRE
jgi:serine/threonine protein kinase